MRPGSIQYMKRCPECGRDYNDDSLSFCLDDGSELLFGASSGSRTINEPQTAVFPSTVSSDDIATRAYGGVTAEEATREADRPPLDASSARTRKFVIATAIAA